MNIGSSPYHTIGALFCRGSDGNLLAIEGQNSAIVLQHWSALAAQICTDGRTTATLSSGFKVDHISIEISKLEGVCSYPQHKSHAHTVREIYREKEDCYVGLFSCHLVENVDCTTAFRDEFETFFLLETTLSPSSTLQGMQNIHAHQLSQKITALFTTTLLNIASNNEWSIGIDHFVRQVFDFVARNKRLQMALPAFPCKSPNMRKVGGCKPDMAERVALQTLHTFTENVRSIYSPGVTIWIISDGHVFSDCIGVDDRTVQEFDDDLQRAYRAMFNSTEDHQAIRFRSLTEMLFANPNVLGPFSQSGIEDFHIDHPIGSSRMLEAERARQILMAGCQSSRTHFRKLLADQHPATLSLYRGQARFMQEDLAAPDFLARSTKQRKKVSFMVAAEMIARNQAYSNLLELLLPNYVRLSIHAHSNRGPKFGIRLFPRDKIRAIDVIQDRHDLVPIYEFQVPTPWHNSIIKVAGDRMIYLGRAEIVRKAIAGGEFEGAWVDDDVCGGHFALRPVIDVSVSSVATEDSDTKSITFVHEKQVTIVKNQVPGLVTATPMKQRKKLRFVFRLHGKACEVWEISRQLARRVIK